MRSLKLKFNRIGAKGFTLIELLVVIAIIGILASITSVGVTGAREKARTARAQADLKSFQIATELLSLSTNLHPNKTSLSPCIQSVEVYLNSCAAGLECTDGGFPGWSGPYVSKVPLDPWGTNYFFDPDYICGPNTSGCGGLSQTVRVLQSFGPDKTQTYGNGDDIVIVLCKS